MDIHMVFLEKTEKLAQKLQKNVPFFCALVFVLFSQGSLFANEWEEPVVLLNDPLVPAIELQEGVISEVVVVSNQELAIPTNESEGQDLFQIPNTQVEKHTVQIVTSNHPSISIVSLPEKKGKGLFHCQIFQGNNSKPRMEGENLPVKSIASPGLIGFLGICLNRSELPSKNFSTPCENCLLRSMTLRSASDWRFSWQPVRTTSHWLSSTNSSKSQKNLIQRPFLNHTHNTSDISSTWSNGMGECQVKSSPMKKMALEDLGILAEVKRNPNLLPKTALMQKVNDQTLPVQNPRRLL